jgi:hypothetical protein
MLFVTILVPSGHSHGRDLESLRSRVTELEDTLRARSAEIDRLKSGLAAFKIRYREQVGLLHDELDELERAIADAELGEIAKLLEGEADRQPASPAGERHEPQPRYTSDAVRRLFRDVARAIHPDLARDEIARDRRHTLMVEANRAYAQGDIERLRWILQAWEKTPHTLEGKDSETTRLRLRVVQLEEQLELCAGDLVAIRDTSLWKLKAMVDEAAARGKDLVGDTVRRLKRDILVARNRVDAMQNTSR